jgi:hypothetical protein
VYISSSVKAITVISQKKMMCEEGVAAHKSVFEKLKESDHWGVGVDGRIILKWIYIYIYRI